MSDGFAPIPQADSSAAPPLAPKRPSGLPVFALGAVTTALACAGVAWAESNGMNPMGFYLDYVLNVGAFLVGLVASSGFAIASWMTGTKISGRILAGTLLILAVGYFGAQYFSYSQAFPGGLTEGGAPISFFTWFDLTSRNISFQGEHGETGSALGWLGYGVRALELAAFVGGGAIIPFALRGKPFCESCSRYMKTKQVAAMPAGLADKLIGNKSPEREAQRAQLVESSSLAVKEIFEGGGKSAQALRDAIAKHGAKKGGPVRVEISLSRCAGCNSGHLAAAHVAQQGRSVKRTALGRKQLEPAVVEGMVQI